MKNFDAANIRTLVQELVEAKETNLGLEITVPVAYPGGDLVTVVMERSGQEYLVHDASFGSMRVTALGVRLSGAVTDKLKEAAARYNCSFINGRVSTISKAADIAISIALVANASRAVADQAMEYRRYSDAQFRVEVAERLRAFVGDRVRENEEVKGQSGTTYRLPAIVLDKSQAKPSYFFGTLTSRTTVPRHFAEFYDLHQAYSDVVNEAVYDDTSDIRSEDKILLGKVCDLIAFNQTQSRFQGLFGGDKTLTH